MSKKRIIAEQATTEIFNDDWLVKDSVTQGTTKIQPSVFKAWINDGMATEEDIETIVENIADTYSTSESYAEGDLCIHEYALFKCIGATTGTWDSTKWESTTIAEIISTIDLSAEAISYDNTSSGLEAENVQDAIDAVETALETKAEQSGVYDDLVVGTAQNLLSESFTEDKVPYNFRQSFNGARLEDEIVGGTVAWNQIYNYTVDGESLGVSVLSQNGVVTISGTTTGAGSGKPLAWTDFKSVIGHKYIYLIDFQMPNDSYIMDQYNISTAVNAIGRVFNASFDALIPQLRYSASGIVFNISNKHLSIIDLTQALGSTIADYLYTIDQANAGAGLAKLQEWGFCTKSYYAYNSGALMSVNASSHVTVGFNQWDEVWELGAFVDATGLPSDYSDRIRTKNFIPIKPSTKYYVKSDKPTRQYFYDKNKNYLGTVETYTRNNEIFTTPSNGYYMKFFVAPAYGTTYNHDICINVSDTSKNGTYEPYTKHTYPLDSDLTLRGIPKLDSNNNLYYDGDIYKSDGSVKRRYGVVDLGTLTWSYSNGFFRTSDINSLIKHPTNNLTKANVICEMYKIETWNEIENTHNLCFAVSSGSDPIIFCNTSYTDATTFKTAMNGVYLVYELYTPTSETADAFINPQIVDARGTEEYVDYAESQGTRDVAIPVGHNSKYYADLKSKIENIPDVPSTNGTYTLKATRSASGVTYAWVSG